MRNREMSASSGLSMASEPIPQDDRMRDRGNVALLNTVSSGQSLALTIDDVDNDAYAIER